MKNELEVGIRHIEQKKVVSMDSAIHYGSGSLDVLATPAMIALMEHTALKAVFPYLGDGQDTVGFEISVKHLKPTPIGQTIECEAVLIETDQKKLVFELTARQNNKIIGKGHHIRYIIHKQTFMAHIKR